MGRCTLDEGSKSKAASRRLSTRLSKRAKDSDGCDHRGTVLKRRDRVGFKVWRYDRIKSVNVLTMSCVG